MASLSATYRSLFEDFRRVESEMATGKPDLQRDLITTARRIVRFEITNGLPRLKELVLAHRSAVEKIEVATAKLTRLASSIRSQESYVAAKFAEGADTTVDALDLLGWRESARIGTAAIESLRAGAVELEAELKNFVRDHKGASDCLGCDQWSKSERETYSVLSRDVMQELQAREDA